MVLLLLVLGGCLLPFLHKAVHIDDPLFIWSARQIQLKWWDFYGFGVNWYGYVSPASNVIMNPPLTSYYLAGVTRLMGFRELVLHGAMLLPALGAAAGTYQLARRLCQHPALATALAMFCPVFIVSASNIMSDVPMLCLWLWACVFWIDGVTRQQQRWLAAGAVGVLAAALAKYFAACLLPLFLVYAVAHWRRWRWGYLWLLLPVAGLLAYQWFTRHLYHVGLIGQAISYSAQVHDEGGWHPHLLAGLAFTGGCLAPAVGMGVLAAVATLRRPSWPLMLLWLGGVGLFAGAVLSDLPRIQQPGPLPANVLLQLLIFAAAGVLLLALALQRRSAWTNPVDLLLFCWLLGTFVFAVACNWTVSARNILPMAPAVGILAVRHCEQALALRRRVWVGLGWASALVGGGLSLWIAQADLVLANGTREAAATVHQRTAASGRTVWFEGHWGFQFYMQHWGAKALDFYTSRCSRGDFIAVPQLNSNLRPLPAGYVQQIDQISEPSPVGVTTMNAEGGAGFYSDMWGPLPFCFGSSSGDRCQAFLVDHAIQYHQQ